MNALMELLIPAAGVVSLAGNVLAVRMVRSLRGRWADAERRAATDPLTGLANRAGLNRSLAEIADGGAYDLVLVDLDRVKPVNDTYGHAAGDALLVEVGRRLAEVLADVDDAVVARLGGDEFVLAAPAPAPLAQLLGEEVIRALVEPVAVCDGVAVTVRASVGAVHAETGETPSRVLAAADTAMYEVKVRGGDGLVEHEGLLPEVAGRPVVRLRDMAALGRTLGVAA